MPDTTEVTTSSSAALEAIDDSGRRRWLRRLLDNRDRLAVAVAVCEAHRLGEVAEIRRVLAAVEYEVGTEFHPVWRQLRPVWDERDADLMHDGVQRRNAECPICNPAQPGLQAVLRIAA